MKKLIVSSKYWPALCEKYKAMLVAHPDSNIAKNIFVSEDREYELEYSFGSIPGQSIEEPNANHLFE